MLTPEGPVSVDRSESASRVASRLGAEAFTAGDTVVIPAYQGSLGSGRGRQLLAHELVHVRQQRQLGPDLPSEASPAGQALERQARAAESMAIGAATRTAIAPSITTAPSVATAPALALARRPGRSTEATHRSDGRSAAVAGTSALSAPGSWGTESLVDWSPAPSAPIAHAGRAATVQRSVEVGDVQSETTPAGEGSGAAEADLDELARQLYERIRRRLRRELLLDRERSGFLTDAR